MKISCGINVVFACQFRALGLRLLALGYIFYAFSFHLPARKTIHACIPETEFMDELEFFDDGCGNHKGIKI
jgi:hypothetical protein